MKLQFSENTLVVTREYGDPRFSGVANGAGESRLLYHIKNTLNEEGLDLIKKRMYKDGHMVDDMQQYLRTRVMKPGQPFIYIYNDNWAFRGAEEYLNEFGEVELAVVKGVMD